MTDCDIDELDKEGIFTESETFSFINNKIGIIRSNALSGNTNLFNFTKNEIKEAEGSAISINFLQADITR